MTPLTEWYVQNRKRKTYEFNHFEDGHVPYTQEAPLATTQFQKSAWAGQRWVRHYCWLTADHKVVHWEPLLVTPSVI